MNALVSLHVGCARYGCVMMVIHICTIAVTVVIVAVDVGVCDKRFLDIVVYTRDALHNVIDDRFDVLGVDAITHTIVYDTAGTVLAVVVVVVVMAVAVVIAVVRRC